MINTSRIGTIENYYGGLHVKSENSKYYWAIENYNGFVWKEIPLYLYEALCRYESDREKVDG